MNKFFKYIIQGVVIYLLFKYVPQTPMKDNDIIIVTAILLLLSMIVENCYQLYFNKHQSEECSCNIKENFDPNAINVEPINEPVFADSTVKTQKTPAVKTKPVVNVDDLTINNSSDINSISNSSDMISIDNSSNMNSSDDSKIELEKIKNASNVEFQHAQQQMQQVQNAIFGKSLEDVKNQIKRVENAPKPIPAQAPQISYPMQTTTDTKNLKGYVKNADGSYTMSTINPISQEPFSYNYTDYNTFPPSEGKTMFEYGYSFLPPANWYPTPVVPPVCVPSGPTCPVCPIYTGGTNLDLKEWNSSLSVTPPEQINIKIN